MFCARCGTAMSADASFCPSCGTPASVSTGGPPPPLPANAVPAAPPAVAPQMALAPPTEDKAVISLILGILSLVSLSILTGIPAIILGKMSRNNIRASGGRLGGDGMALIGIILGWISVGLAAFFLLIFVFMIAYVFPHH